MKRAIRILVPILLAIALIACLIWYLFVYDPNLTRDFLLSQARRFERQGAQAEDGFCVEPGSLIVKMDRKRLTVGDRGELGQFVHGVKLNGIFSHGKSSCNGLYNRGGFRYNKAAKRQWTTDRSFKKTEAGTSISSAII